MSASRAFSELPVPLSERKFRESLPLDRARAAGVRNPTLKTLLPLRGSNQSQGRGLMFRFVNRFDTMLILTEGKERRHAV